MPPGKWALAGKANFFGQMWLLVHLQLITGNRLDSFLLREIGSVALSSETI
jgi:hypothetical protein